MKKLLLLLCVPLIGVGQQTYVPETKVIHGDEYQDWVDRELLLLAENYAEENSNKKSEFQKFEGFYILKITNWESHINRLREDGEIYRRNVDENHEGVINQPYPPELILLIKEWNDSLVYFSEAFSKNYNLTDILMEEFEYSLTFKTDFWLDCCFRSRRTFTEARAEGSTHIFILRRLFSYLPFALYLLIIYFIYKRIKKRYLKRITK